MKPKDPCWKGYKQIGMKKKGKKQVPNCVPEETIEDMYGNTFAEVIDLIKPDPIVSEGCCKKCNGSPCKCGNSKEPKGGDGAKPGSNKNYIRPMGDLEEAVRIPAKTGNIILVTLTWRAKYYMIKMYI